MSDIPKPPEWDKKNVELSEEAESELKSLSTEGFFGGPSGIREKAEELDWDVIGEGTGRLVLTSDTLPSGTVAKVAKGQKGSHFNSNEASTTEAHPKSAHTLRPCWHLR